MPEATFLSGLTLQVSFQMAGRIKSILFYPHQRPMKMIKSFPFIMIWEEEAEQRRLAPTSVLSNRGY